jgi:hypothetical protein
MPKASDSVINSLNRTDQINTHKKLWRAPRSFIKGAQVRMHARSQKKDPSNNAHSWRRTI